MPDAVQLAAAAELAAEALLPDPAGLPAAPTAAELLPVLLAVVPELAALAAVVLRFEQDYPTAAVRHSATVVLLRPAAVPVAEQAAVAVPELAAVQALAVAVQTGYLLVAEVLRPGKLAAVLEHLHQMGSLLLLEHPLTEPVLLFLHT